MIVTIRPAAAADGETLERITRDAFWDVYKPGCDEHYLVHRLHELNAVAPGLDLVAEADGSVIGNAVCVPATLTTARGDVHRDVLCLGPLTVAPGWQRRGVGKALLARMAQEARARAWRAIFLMGSPDYYPRSGYRPIREFGVTLENGEAPDDAMALELMPGRLSMGGVYAEPPVYRDLPRETVAQFDRKFPRREKHVLPTQMFHEELE